MRERIRATMRIVRMLMPRRYEKAAALRESYIECGAFCENRGGAVRLLPPRER